MQFLSCILSSVLISLVLGLISSAIQKQNDKELVRNQKEEHVVLRLPKVCLWVGLLCVAFFAALLLWAILSSNETAPLWVIFCLFILVGMVLVYEALVWKIEIFRHEDYFLIRTVYKVHTVRYRDCIGYRFATNELVLKTRKKKYRIDLMATNFDFFLSMLTQYNVPEIEKS